MAGYTRNDTLNNIADGNVISAADLDGEFDAIDAAFDEATGHVHDGTANNGAPITKVGPAQDLVVSTGAVTPKTDNAVDLGTSSFEFKDLYIDGTANIDSLVADTADINAGTIDGVTLGTNSAVTQAQIDNININGNAIITTDTNGNLALTPNGTGEVDISKVDIDSGTIDGTTIGGASAAAGTFTNLTASGTVNFTGATVSNGGTFTTIDINGGSIDGVTIGTNSAVTDLRIDNLQLNGNTISSTDTNGNIAITPNGTGEVDISKVDIDSGAIDGTTIGANSAAAGTFTNLTATGTVTIPDNAISGDKVEGGTINATTITTLTSTTGNITTVNATTVDATDIEVTNIKAKDGTASASIADSTGVFTHATTTVFPAGAVGTPSITTTGDTNTGIFFPAADTIAFAEGGVEAMRINSSGNVGIGTTSPSEILTVTKDQNAATVFLVSNPNVGSSASSYAQFTSDSANAALGATSAATTSTSLGGRGSTFFINTGSSDSAGGIALLARNSAGYITMHTGGTTERMRITSAGEVIVGGTTGVDSTSFLGSSQPHLTVEGTNIGALLALSCNDASIVNTQILGGIGFYGADTTSNTPTLHAYVAARASGTHAAGDNPTDLVFATTAAGSATVTERMRIDSSGNVGIGTSSPTSKLTVSGDVAATNVYVTNGADANAIVGNASRAYANFYQVGASTGGYVSFHTTPSTVGNLAERMRITSAGEVLVGGTTAISSEAGALTISSPVQNTTIPKLNLFRDDISVVSGNQLGYINFWGNDTTSNTPTRLAYIEAMASGTHAAGDNPTDLVFGTTPIGSATVAEKMRLTEAGYLRLASGSGGIQFGGDTAAANALDDYEEGTWTPVIADASTGGNASVTTPTSATYTKIGNLVNVQCFFTDVSTVGLTAGNDIFIRGFPFTALSVSGTTFVPGSIIAQQITFSGYLTPYITDNNTFGRIAENTTGAVADFILVSEFSSGVTDFWMSLTYQAA